MITCKDDGFSALQTVKVTRTMNPRCGWYDRWILAQDFIRFVLSNVKLAGSVVYDIMYKLPSNFLEKTVCFMNQ